MTTADPLEAGYRRWLRCYPRSYRRDHDAEILAVLMSTAVADRHRPDRGECLALVLGALRIRVRGCVPAADRSLRTAVRLMYLTAVAELVVGLTVLATMGDLRDRVTARHPGYTSTQWRGEVATDLRPLIQSAVVAALLCVIMAWSTGRGHRWSRVAFALFTAVTTASLINGVEHGSMLYAPADLLVGGVLWAIQLSTLVYLSAPLRPVPWRPSRRT